MVLLTTFSVAVDALVVTEIMYDAPGTDTGREWIEVYNDSSDSIQFTDWKLFEANSNHSLSTARGDGVLSAGEYAIVSVSGTDSLVGYESYTGDVYDSSFSLNNSGESFSFKTPSGSFVAQVTYVGGVLAAGDGNSLHWINGQWSSRSPNPGSDPLSASGGGQVVNTQAGTGVGNTQPSSSTVDSASNATSTAAFIPQKPVYKMTVSQKPSQPIARSPVVITPRVQRTYKGEEQQYTIGIVRLVTGDGREVVQSTTKPMSVVYTKAGRYRMIVEYMHSNLDPEPIARYSADIVVIDPTVVIGRYGSSITLTNESDQEIDLSGYYLQTKSDKLVLARDTILLPEATISIGGSSLLDGVSGALVELVSADGGSKVSAREFVASSGRVHDTKITTRSAVSINDRAVVPIPVAGPTQTSSSRVEGNSVHQSQLYSEVRDRSLIQYEAGVPVHSLKQVPDNTASPVVVEAVERQYYSTGLLLVISWFAITLLAILAVVRSFRVSKSEEALDDATTVELGTSSKAYAEFGNIEEYLVTDYRKASSV